MIITTYCLPLKVYHSQFSENCELVLFQMFSLLQKNSNMWPFPVSMKWVCQYQVSMGHYETLCKLPPLVVPGLWVQIPESPWWWSLPCQHHSHASFTNRVNVLDQHHFGLLEILHDIWWTCSDTLLSRPVSLAEWVIVVYGVLQKCTLAGIIIEKYTSAEQAH